MARPTIGNPVNTRFTEVQELYLGTFPSKSAGVRAAVDLAMAAEAEKVRKLIEARATLLRLARQHVDEPPAAETRAQFLAAEHGAMLVVLEQLAALVGVEL